LTASTGIPVMPYLSVAPRAEPETDACALLSLAVSTRRPPCSIAPR
jgi:hypothetical protein